MLVIFPHRISQLSALLAVKPPAVYEVLDSHLAIFLAFFAAFFSFGDIAGVFLLSLVLFFSLLILILTIVDMELNLKIGYGSQTS